MPRAIATTPKTRRSAPTTERKRTPVRRKPAALRAEAAPQFDAAAHYDEIAHAAYLNWMARGGENGSPEQDWFLAEQSVRAQYAA
jgi:hypothetical protein